MTRLQIQKSIKTAVSVATVLAVSPLSVMADENINLQNVDSNFRSITNITFAKLVSAGLNFILIAAALVAFFFLLIGGVQWILAGGDKEGTEKARKKITNALIGLAIVFSAYALAFLVNALFGVNILQLTIKPISTY